MYTYPYFSCRNVYVIPGIILACNVCKRKPETNQKRKEICDIVICNLKAIIVYAYCIVVNMQ